MANAKGDLHVSKTSTGAVILAVGSDGQVLTADSAQTSGIKWATPGPTLITGATGVANAAAAPSETWQILSSNAAANGTTTLATVMTTQTLQTGTYTFLYMIRYQSAATTTGIKFAVDYGGTVTWVLVRHLFAQELSTAASLAADSSTTAAAVGLLSSMEFRADASVAGPTASSDTASADMLWTIEGVMAVSTSSDLLLQSASEVAANTQVMSGTQLFLRRLA
jgi:hypothetical protein